MTTHETRLQRIREQLDRLYEISRALQESVVTETYDARVRATGERVMLTAIIGTPNKRALFRLQRNFPLVQLEHRCIQRLRSCDMEAAIPYYVADFVQGPTLDLHLRQLGPLPVHEAFRIARDLAEGLEYAHRHDVVHRSLTTQNVVLTEQAAVMRDFGLALESFEILELDPLESVVAWPIYISPEQLLGEPVTTKSDIYVLGVILYELLTGRLPFANEPFVDMMLAMHEGRTPRPSQKRALPAHVDDIVMKAMARVPEQRYTGAELVETLSRNL